MKDLKTELFSMAILMAILIFFDTASMATARPENTFFAGSAKIKITPETPIPMSGYGGRTAPFINQISVKMRNQSPYTNTFMITHCNGSSGYLVTDDAFPKAGTTGSGDKYHPAGGYEVNSSRAKQGAEKVLIENLLEMINQL